MSHVQYSTFAGSVFGAFHTKPSGPPGVHDATIFEHEPLKQTPLSELQSAKSGYFEATHLFDWHWLDPQSSLDPHWQESVPPHPSEIEPQTFCGQLFDVHEGGDATTHSFYIGEQTGVAPLQSPSDVQSAHSFADGWSKCSSPKPAVQPRSQTDVVEVDQHVPPDP